jgi:molybdenum cofactor guanylyltransferase
LNISCIALAGGKSTRLGRNKLAEIIGGKTVLERVLNTLSLFRGDIIVVASGHLPLPEIPSHYEVKVVNDIYPGMGSLGGIYTGLYNSTTQHNIVVACDMPFLNPELLRYMVSISEGFDLVAYNQNDRPEPLHAIYSRACLAPMKTLIEHNQLRIINILPYIKVRYVGEEEIARYDPQHLSFLNINTETEVQRARQIASNLSL